jgi:hypothetical protein
MEKEQIYEFGAVRESALAVLRLGKLLAGHHSECQFLILPSFENPVSWDVVTEGPRKERRQTRLYRSTWRMDVDGPAVRSPVERLKHPRPYPPTLETDWVLIEPERLDAVVSRLRSVRIPLIVANPFMGCDGTFFELGVDHRFLNARVGWWCYLPQEWQELAPIVTELQQLFNSAWEQGRA